MIDNQNIIYAFDICSKISFDKRWCPYICMQAGVTLHLQSIADTPTQVLSSTYRQKEGIENPSNIDLLRNHYNTTFETIGPNCSLLEFTSKLSHCTYAQAQILLYLQGFQDAPTLVCKPGCCLICG